MRASNSPIGVWAGTNLKKSLRPIAPANKVSQIKNVSVRKGEFTAHPLVLLKTILTTDAVTSQATLYNNSS